MEKLNFYQPFPQRCSDLEGKEKKLTGGVILDWLDLTLCISKGPTPYRTELPVLMQAFSWLSRISTENEELVEVSEKSAYVAYTHPPTTSHNKGRGRGRGRGSGVARGRGRSTARKEERYSDYCQASGHTKDKSWSKHGNLVGQSSKLLFHP